MSSKNRQDSKQLHTFFKVMFKFHAGLNALSFLPFALHTVQLMTSEALWFEYVPTVLAGYRHCKGFIRPVILLMNGGHGEEMMGVGK